jgi:hypothetical protein
MMTTAVFLTDGYADRPRSERAALEERIRQLKARRWSEPGDRRELDELLAEAERELRALDRGGGR